MVDNEFGNILITKFNNSGQIVWNETVIKEQRTSDTKGYKSSFSVTISDDFIYLLHNDMNNEESDKYDDYQTKITTLDVKTGEQSSKFLIHDFQFKYRSAPRNSCNGVDSQYLYFSLQHKKKGYLSRTKLN
tara:strand:+ start:473 stop:865 length:393 start_codon:yes stop_codon:yes gene_type:complete